MCHRQTCTPVHTTFPPFAIVPNGAMFHSLLRQAREEDIHCLLSCFLRSLADKGQGALLFLVSRFRSLELLVHNNSRFLRQRTALTRSSDTRATANGRTEFGNSAVALRPATSSSGKESHATCPFALLRSIKRIFRHKNGRV